MSVTIGCKADRILVPIFHAKVMEVFVSAAATSFLVLNSYSVYYEFGHVAHICSRRESRVRVSVESTLIHLKCSVVDDIQSFLMVFRDVADADHEQPSLRTYVCGVKEF